MPDPTLTFDASRKLMTVEFEEPPGLDTLKAISTRLKKDEARSLHVMMSLDWDDPQAPGWDDPRHVPQLEKVLNPSLETFIFDNPFSHRAFERRSTLGDICDVLAACPKLQRAFITGCSAMRKTRHEHIRELHLKGDPLDSSVIPALAASQFPALERLVLKNLFRAEELAASLRSIEAPRLSEVYIDGVGVLELLAIIGTAALPWTLCIIDFSFDDVDGLFEVLNRHNALRSGKLRLQSENFFDSEIAKLNDMGVTVEKADHLFYSSAYEDW